MDCFPGLLELQLKMKEGVKVGRPERDGRVPSATGRSGFQGLTWGLKTTKIPFVLISALNIVTIGPSSGNTT